MMMFANMTGALLAYIYASYPEIETTTVQLVMTLPGLVGLFVSFIVGPLALKFNKKYLLLITAATNLLSVVAFAVYGVRGPFVILIFAAAVSGITRGSAMALINASIGEFIGAAKSASYIAISGAVMHGGSASIGLIGSAIGAAEGGAHWNRAFYLGLLIIPTMIVFAMFMAKAPDERLQTDEQLTETPPTDIDQRDAAQSSQPNTAATPKQQNEKAKLPARVYIIIILTMMFSMSFAVFVLNLSSYIITEHELGTSTDVGLINSVATISGIVIGFTYLLWAKMFKNWLVPVGYGVAAVGLFILMTVNTTIWGAYIASLLIGFGLNLTNPFIMSYVMSITPPKLIPVSMSLSAGGMNLSFFAAPYVLSFVGRFMSGDFGNNFLIALMIAVLSTIASIILFPYAKKNLTPN